MEKSILKEEIISIQKYFLLDLEKDNNIDKCYEILDKIILNYRDNFIKDSKYNIVIREFLNSIKENGSISYKLIKDIAKKYNETNNKYLIKKEENRKNGLLNLILKIFKLNLKEKITIDTIEYDKEEEKLFNEFNIIAKRLDNYVKEVYKLENIVIEGKFNNIISKVFKGEEIYTELIQLLDGIRDYRNYILSERNSNIKMESSVAEEALSEEDVNDKGEFQDKSIIIIESIEDQLNNNKELIEETVKNKETNETIINKFQENKKSIYKDILIAEAFNDNIFKIFLNYCKENNLKNLDQIRNFDFDELDKLKGFGVAKKEKFIKRYNEVMGNEYIKNLKGEREEDKIKKIDLKECYKNLDIAILECFNKINSKLIEQIKHNNINTIEELYLEVHNNMLSVPNLGLTKIKYIKEALENLNKEPQELLRSLIDQIKVNSDYNILVERTINNKTLQQIGEEYGVTRERIRQKEKKIIKSIEAILHIFVGISNINDIKLVTFEEILDVSNLDEEEKKCLKNVLINADNFECKYLSEVDKFLVNGDINEIIDKIKLITNGIPDIVSINNELIYDLEEYKELDILSLDEIVNIIVTLGYKRVNDYLFRGTVSKTKIYNFIVKEFFKDGIAFNNTKDINKFISIINEKFDMKEDSIRNIKAKIETSCILCDRGSYIHPEWVDIDEGLLEEITEYIDDNEQETIYLNQIYLEFESQLNESGIKNRYYLQGILKYYFSDNYNFTKDTLYKGNIKHNRNYIFNKYIKDKGRPVSKEDVENDFKGWTPIMIALAAEECKYVLKWDKGGFIHASLIRASLEDISRMS